MIVGAHFIAETAISTQPETIITVLYTAALHGRLERLPYLLTLIKQVRNAAEGPVLLVDLGRSCGEHTWICQATGGRAMLVAMDAMGYDAFHLGPLDSLYTQPTLVAQLKQVIATPLAAGPWIARFTRMGRQFQVINGAALAKLQLPPAALTLALRLSETPYMAVEMRHGQPIVWIDSGLSEEVEPAIQVGHVRLACFAAEPYVEILAHTQLALSSALIPDPTMTGVIEFVTSEAHYAEQKRRS